MLSLQLADLLARLGMAGICGKLAMTASTSLPKRLGEGGFHPLGRLLRHGELEVLSEFYPEVSFATLTMPTDSVLLAKQMIGLSISGNRDLAPRGFGHTHLRDAMIEFTRNLLARGARIAYEGDFRGGGFRRISRVA